MYVEHNTANYPWSGQEPRTYQETEQHQQLTRIEKKPTWTVKQQKPQVTPTVAPAMQMRRPGAAGGRQYGGHLSDAHLAECCFDYHLAGELHSRSPQIELHNSRLAEAPESTMKVTTRTVKEESSNRREHRVSEITMQRRHRPPIDSAQKAISHD